MVERGEADAMICGLVGRFHKKLGYLRSVFDFDAGRAAAPSAMTGVINDQGAWFFLDTHVQLDPTRRADRRGDAAGGVPAEAVRHRAQGRAAVALQLRQPRRRLARAKMRKVREILSERVPKLEVDGEMHGRHRAGTRSCASASSRTPRSSGRANLFVMPNLDAANIAYNMIRVMTDGVGDRPDPDGPGQAGAHPDAGLDRRAAWST